MKDGVVHGRGFNRWDNGKTYEGEWRHGECDGWGVTRWPDGEWFEGLYRGDRRTRGACHSADGVYVLDGEWAWNGAAHTGQMQGWGVRRQVKTGGNVTTMETVYEGQWEEHNWHGCGTWHSPDGSGDMYHGQFDHGKRSGTGSMLFGGTGGGSYVGEWKDDVFHGRGVRIWGDGTRH
ncbi:hypothetical protein Pelo_19771 [Pelomyxa schiedti]|nr:hypothetical protein Pelo_19771 [Pelomyxa schiedti]